MPLSQKERDSLPRWQSHKIVRADEIVEIANTTLLTTRNDSGVRWRLRGGVIVEVTKDLIARGQPAVGDFLVLYDDAYVSWSPAAAFKDGYTLLP